MWISIKNKDQVIWLAENDKWVWHLIYSAWQRLSKPHTIFTVSIGTPYLLTILLLNFEIVHSTTCWCAWNIATCMLNNVDADQRPHFAATNLSLHCLYRPICPNTYGYTVHVHGRCHIFQERQLSWHLVFSFLFFFFFFFFFFLAGYYPFEKSSLKWKNMLPRKQILSF